MIRVISWNVNSVNVRLPRLLALLDREKPDYVCLQELKCTTEKFPFEAIAEKGYHASIFGQKTYNGVAVLSKEPSQTVVSGFGDNEDDPSARFLVADFNRLKIASAYIPNGQEVGAPAYDFKLKWFERCRKYLDDHVKPSEAFIIAGDFNVAPLAIDVHDPAAWEGKVLCSEKERDALSRLMNWGLTDTFRHHHAYEVAYSWWDYRNLGFPFNRGLRIDMVYASELLAQRCSAASILRDERKGEKPSDHAPVVADFNDW